MVSASPHQAVAALRRLVLVAALVLPATGQAAPEPLRPTPGQIVPLGTLELEFALRDDPETYQPPIVEISDSALLDAGGDFREDPVEVVGTEPVDAAGTFVGRAEGTWLAQAGTYWWKAYGESCVFDTAADDEQCEEVSTAPRRIDVVARPLGLQVSGDPVQAFGPDQPLAVAVRCDDACTATLGAALWRGTGPGRVPVQDVQLHPVELVLAAERAEEARWELSPLQAAAVRRVQDQGASVYLEVEVEAEAEGIAAQAETTFRVELEKPGEQAREPVRAGTMRPTRVARAKAKAAGRLRPRSLPAGRAGRLTRLRWTAWGGVTARGSGVLQRRAGSVAVQVLLSDRRACRSALRYGVVRWRTGSGRWNTARLPGRCRPR